MNLETDAVTYVEILPSVRGTDVPPCFLRLALASVRVSLAEAEALAEAIEGGDLEFVVTWTPTPGQAAATVRSLRAAVARLREREAERAADAARRAAAGEAPAVGVTEALQFRAAARTQGGQR